MRFPLPTSTVAVRTGGFPARAGTFAARTGGFPARAVAAALAVAVAAAVLPACGGSASAPAGNATASVPAGGAQAVFNRLTEAQRIGQLFMVGAAATGVSQSTLTAIGGYHVGNVILTGRSSLGVSATRSVVNGLQSRATAAATGGVPLFVSTDQEGGYVQVLSGPGFSTIPQALTQGGWATSTLQAAAAHWGGQLAAAGVNLNLAPVLDTVPVGQVNPPIGYFNREYDHTPDGVASHGAAVIRGMAQGGIASTVKHFPGLGRVSANTDTAAGVTDYVTTAGDRYLAPFAAGIAAGTSFVMMSSAFYHLIDPGRPAVFSPIVIGSLLRTRMGFSGVVISDSLSAAQLSPWSPGQRAVNFLEAGGTMALINDPGQLPAMVAAVSSRVASDSAFRSKVDAAALLVLRMKQSRGLVGAVVHDYNGDGRSDLAVWRPATGVWWVRGVTTAQWGKPGDVPVPGDYNGDGRTDLAVWRPATGVWWVHGVETVPWGLPSDVPVVGDVNGDGRTDLAVWRPENGVWYVRGVTSAQWGRPGDIPVPGDYNGDGRTDLAVWRPENGVWYVRGVAITQWGLPGDVPVPADYNGDGRTDLAVWRPSTGLWYVRGVTTAQWGQRGDIPVPGDYNGDGRTDFAVWRPSTGTWWVRGVLITQWGKPGDVPV